MSTSEVCYYPPMRLVLIEWVDSYGCSSVWRKLDEIVASPLVCRSVGWIVQENPECKVIVPHMTQEIHEHVIRQGCGDMTIPSCAIIKIIDLIPNESGILKGSQ